MSWTHSARSNAICLLMCVERLHKNTPMCLVGYVALPFDFPTSTAAVPLFSVCRHSPVMCVQLQGGGGEGKTHNQKTIITLLLTIKVASHFINHRIHRTRRWKKQVSHIRIKTEIRTRPTTEMFLNALIRWDKLCRPIITDGADATYYQH